MNKVEEKFKQPEFKEPELPKPKTEKFEITFNVKHSFEDRFYKDLNLLKNRFDRLLDIIGDLKTTIME